MRIFNLVVGDFEKVLELGNRVLGDGYLDVESLLEDLDLGTKDGINCNFVAYEDTQDKLIGFRTARAPGAWELNEACSVDQWGVPADKVCYFHSIVVDPNYRQQGVARALMNKSIESAKLQGAVAGLAHNWSGSPDNSAYQYMIKCGGKVIAYHPKFWVEEEGRCSACGSPCTCTGRETILYFDEE